MPFNPLDPSDCFYGDPHQFIYKLERDQTKIQNISAIFVATSIIIVLGGVFLALASHQILPHGINAISNLGYAGYTIGYGAIGLGMITSIVSLVKLVNSQNNLKIIKNHPTSRIFCGDYDYINDYIDDLPKGIVGKLPPDLMGTVFEEIIPYNLEKTLDLWKNGDGLSREERGLREVASKKIINRFKRRGKKLTLEGLTSLPDIFAYLPFLEELDLFCRGLKTLPESMRNLRQLKSLRAHSCSFATFPNVISGMENLEFAEFTHNRLTSLPAWLFRLPNINRVWVEHNAFSRQEAALIQGYVDQARARGQIIDCDITIRDFNVEQHSRGNSLEELIAFWEAEYQKMIEKLRKPNESQAVDFSLLKTYEGKGHLFTFLQKATICEDFKNEETKPLIILEIHELLCALVREKKFREIAPPLLEEGNSSCGDRVGLFLNYLRIQRLLAQANDLDDLALAKLIIGIERLDQLDRISREKARTAVDKIEVILGYQVKLRQTLVLPLATHGMLYPKMFNASESELKTVEQLVRKKTKDFAHILCSAQPWIDRIKEKNPKIFEDIDEKYQELVANTPNEKEQEYKIRVESLVKERELEIQKTVADCTQSWLNAHKKDMNF